MCREAIGRLHGFAPDDDEDDGRIERVREADPVSTLAYRYERCGSTEERMELLAEGLTAIHGSFTLEDVAEIDPRDAGKLLEGMHRRCLVAEVGPGRYRG